MMKLAPRASQQKVQRRPLRLLLSLFLIILALLVVGELGISTRVMWVLTHPDKEHLTTSPAAYGLKYENVVFPSREDHLRISGWFIPALTPSSQTIITVHGKDSNRADRSIGLLNIMQALVTYHYNVLMFDFRAHGASQGTLFSIGEFEQRDLEGAVDYVKSRPDHSGAHIGVLAYSMGAATALLVTAHTPAIEALVADSSFADLPAYLEESLPKFTNLPSFPFTDTIIILGHVLLGISPEQVRPISVVAQIAPRPLLFIHGEADDLIPIANSRELFAAAHNPQAQLWMVPGANHVQSFHTNSVVYLKRVETFFGQSLGPE